MSDLVARNYTLSARGLTLRAADAVLHRNVRVEDALERGVPSQKKAMQLASHTMKRPYNIRDLPREEIYESKSTTRKISNNLGQKPLYPVKQGIRNNSKLYLNPEALLTPRPAPRLYTGNHAIPTGSDWTPIPRISETKTISSDLPLSMTKESYNKQIEESTAKFKKMLHEIQRQKMESKTSLQSLADSTVLKTWLNNAMNMLPSSNNDEILRRMVEELRAEFEEANAMSTAFYSLLDPRFAHEAQIDRTALYPPPSIWHDTRYLSRSWSIDRNTGVSNEKVVTAYHYMERSSFVSQKIMVDAQTLWLSRTSDVNLFTNISSPEFRKTLPLSPSDVENAVRRFATTVRERLLDTWLKDCQELLLHALPVNESADLGTNPEKDDHAKSRQYPEEANALHSKKESPVLNSIEGMQTTYSSFEAQDEMEAWVSSLPSMDEGVTGKKTLLGSRESKTTLSSQLALREVDISENISAQKTKGAQKLMASLATLMGRQLREMVSESLNVVSEFFLQFDNSSLAAKNIEKKRQSAVHAHLAIKSAKLTEAVLHGEGVGTGDGMFDFTPCGDIHRYRRVSRSQIILAALSHLKNIKSSTFNSSLIAVSHKPPESVFTLHMNVKDEEVGIFPTFEELESTVQNIILHIASASTQFPRPDSIAAIKSSEGSHGKLQSKYRLSQVLASSEIQVDPSAGFDEEILEARARIYRSIRGQKAKPLALLKGLKRFEVLFGDEFENKITTAVEGLEDVRSSATLALEGAGVDVTKISDALSNAFSHGFSKCFVNNSEPLSLLRHLFFNIVRAKYGLKCFFPRCNTLLKRFHVTTAPHSDSSKKINDYWGPAKNLLGQKDFLSSLQTYDKDNIPVKTITTIRTKYITDPDFTPEKAAKASKAALGLCKWVIAMECYDRVAKVVKPKKEKLAQSEAELDVLLKELNVKKSELKAVQDDLGALEQNLADAEAKKEKLIADVDLTEKKLIRAQQLIEGLGGENDRWTASSKTLGQLLVAVPGDVLLSSGLIAYLGAFTSTFRTNVVSTWISMNSRLTIPCSSKPSLRMTLGDEVLIRDWNIQGLPTDNFSIENGIVVFNASRWPLMIDPEGAANKWIRNLEKDNALKVIKLTNADYMRTVENAVQFGSPVLLENVGEHLDPTLEPLLLKQTFKQGGVLQIQLGENAIEYSEHFRFYITTKLPNPHYLPETAVRVSLLNFMITPEGLKDQLLAKVVREEKPDLADLKERLIIEGAENARSLKDVEDKILHILSSSEGNILEDEGAINALNSSKVISDDIKVKQTKAEKAEAEIDEVRMEYVPVAENGQLLYFCISSLANIEPTYQYALDWFGNLFIQGIRKSENSSDLQKRIKNLNDYFTYSLYCNICRSLLEKDKLLFSFLLTASIMEGKGEIPFNEWYFLLTGGVASENPNTNPAPTWLSNQSWGQFCRLDDLSAFEGIRESLEKCPDAWQVIYDTDDAHRAPLPQGWDDRINKFQKMLILRCIRQDKIALSVIDYVSETMGEKYVSPPTFNLKACYDDSICTSPLIFVLSAGSDPMSNISKFATVMKKTFESISLGQGQGPKAQKIMERGHKEGFWAVLQNCHLCPSWMPTLEKICENVTEENTHRDYRLWCTTYPSDDFPVAILQNGIKMTIEPPKGLRQNILSVYRNDPICDPEFFDSCSKGRDFRKLLFALCFFHANVQERREYGALGWNNPYEYNNTDLLITMKQVVMFLDLYTDPYKAMNYCAGQCNYGGRVTDDKDRRCLLTILEAYFTPDILEDGFKLTPSGVYKMPNDGSYDHYIQHIESLPLDTTPDVFGFHSNARITKDTKTTTSLFASVLLTQAGKGGGESEDAEESGGGNSKENVITEVANSHLKKIPTVFDMEIAALKANTIYILSYVF
eukprot:Stramenopile-MAST_4_protein_2886